MLFSGIMNAFFIIIIIIIIITVIPLSMQNDVIKFQSPWYKRNTAVLCRVVHRVHEYTVLPSFSSACLLFWFFVFVFLAR